MRGQIRQRVRIGYYPAMTLAEKRKEAKKLLTEQPTRNPGIRFGEAYEQYKEHIAVRNKPRTQAEYKRLPRNTSFRNRKEAPRGTRLRGHHPGSRWRLTSGLSICFHSLGSLAKDDRTTKFSERNWRL